MPTAAINDLAVSSRYLEIVGHIHDAAEGEVCQIVCPNSYEDPAKGFLIRNLGNDDYYEIVDEVTEEDSKMSEEFEFPIIGWNEFDKYFRVLDDAEARVFEMHLKKTRAEETGPSESNESHWIMLSSALICCLGGLVVLLASSAEESSISGVILGSAMIFLFITGAIVSGGWKETENLSAGRKVLAWLPVITGGLVALLLVALVLFAKQSAAKRR
jgi:hypothetical protein